MYFIFESGGKQYKASPGQKVRLEKLPLEVGNKLSLDKLVMFVDDDRVEFGTPYIKGEVLEARVVQHGRGAKIQVIKFKRRKHHLKRLNHRQQWTEVEIGQLAKAKASTASDKKGGSKTATTKAASTKAATTKAASAKATSTKAASTKAATTKAATTKAATTKAAASTKSTQSSAKKTTTAKPTASATKSAGTE